MTDLKRRAVLRSLSTLAGASILVPAAGATKISPLSPAQSDKAVAGLNRGIPSSDNFEVSEIQKDATRADGLIPEFTFDTFVAGKANAQAIALAQQAAAFPEFAFNPLSAFNPFFIYGDVGRGKTHLMHAIGNKILERNPLACVRYVHAYTFLDEVIESYRRKTFDEFKKRYASLDAFLIDDVHLLNGRERTQEELLVIFDKLQERGGVIVMADIHAPKEWFPDAYRDLMNCRIFPKLLTASAFELGSANMELRCNVLRAKAMTMGKDVVPDEETIRFIAARVSSGCIRELESALRNVVAYSRFNGLEISVRVARHALAGITLG